MNEVGEAAAARTQAVRRFASGDETGFQIAFGQCESPIEQACKLGEDGRPVYREDGKILKGPNFRPADVSPFVQPPRPVEAISEREET